MGKAELVLNEAERVKALNLIMKHYSGVDAFPDEAKYFKAATIFKVTLSELSGKKGVEQTRKMGRLK
jgi:hypothetical protein